MYMYIHMYTYTSMRGALRAALHRVQVRLAADISHHIVSYRVISCRIVCVYNATHNANNFDYLSL